MGRDNRVTAQISRGTNGAISGLTASGAELNLLDGAVGGTNTADLALVLDSNGAVDILKTASLRLGTSGSETTITATGAEINKLAGVTGGTSTASKAAILGASRDLDVLNVATLAATTAFIDKFSAASADGAISQKSGYVLITKSASAAVLTIADPTATTDDGKTLTVISTTAQAHTLSNSAGSGFNAAGGSGDIGTFGGAKGDNIVIVAYQGVWYVVSKVNVTLA